MPKSITPKSKTPKSKTPKSKTPKSKTPKSKTPKSTSPVKKYIFGKVYADWCGACQALKPNWDEMISILKKYDKSQSDSNVVANMDGIVIEVIEIQDTNFDSYTKKNKLLNDLTANGYPTIFRKEIEPTQTSKFEYYTGERNPDAMIAWASGKTMGGSNHYKRYRNNKYRHNNTVKKNYHNKSFSQKIAEFWGWK